MMSGINSMNASSYSYVSSGVGSGKLFVPVSPSMVVYSQFEHVAGIAAQEEAAGINIDKVELLNRLIDQLVSMKQTPEITKSVGNGDELTEKQVDTLISNYQQQIKDAVALAESHPYALGGAMLPETGMVLDISL